MGFEIANGKRNDKAHEWVFETEGEVMMIPRSGFSFKEEVQKL